MSTDLRSLVRPEPPPGDRVLTVILTSLFVPGIGADAVGGMLEHDALSRGFGVLGAVVTLMILGILMRELYWQSLRPAPRWTGSDTTNTAVLGGLAALLGAAVTFGAPPEPEPVTGAVVAILYAALALVFAAARRRTLRTRSKALP